MRTFVAKITFLTILQQAASCATLAEGVIKRIRLNFTRSLEHLERDINLKLGKLQIEDKEKGTNYLKMYIKPLQALQAYYIKDHDPRFMFKN